MLSFPDLGLTDGFVLNEKRALEEAREKGFRSRCAAVLPVGGSGRRHKR